MDTFFLRLSFPAPSIYYIAVDKPARGVLHPSLCARIKGANRGFLRRKLVFDHGLFSSYESRQGPANG